MTIFKKLAFFSFLIFGTYQANAANNVDTSGVALGMTTDQARAAAQKAFKAEREGYINFSNSKQIGAYFATQPRRGPASNEFTDSLGILVGFSKNGQEAVTIARFQSFSERNRPTPKNLIDNLIKKYGEPSYIYKSTSNVTMDWQYNVNGALEHWTNLSQKEMCETHESSQSVGGIGFIVPDSFKSECGVRVKADLAIDKVGENGLVEYFMLKLIDNQRGYIDLKQDVDAVKKQQMEHEKQRTKDSAGVKVNL